MKPSPAGRQQRGIGRPWFSPECLRASARSAAIAFKSDGKVSLRSRNDKDFAERYASVVRGLSKLPEETVIDGELVAFDEEGRPSFNALQNYGSSIAPVVYYVFA